jgi:hypothetical protein
MGVDTTTYLADAKNVYGAIQDQVSTLAAFMNLLGDGSKFGKPINDLGIRGYTFLARLTPNWNMGYRPEGYTGVGNNVAQFGNQGLNNATVILKYAYVPVVITGQAQNLTKGNQRAFMQAKALEAKFDMKDIVSHVNVVMVGAERGGQLAQTVAGTLSTTQFTVSTAGGLPGAIYLRVGMPVDLAPITGGAIVATGTITAINYTSTPPLVTFTQTGGPGTPTAGLGVFLSGEAATTTGAFPYTAEGLVSLVSPTGAIQGLDPSIAGQQAWSSYLEDATGSGISPQNMLTLKQFTKNRGGTEPDFWITSSAQINSLAGAVTQLLYYRTDQGGLGKKAIDLGFTTFELAGDPIVEEKDFRPDRMVSMASEVWKKFEALPLGMADDEAGEWTRVSGAGGVADAVQGLLRWYHNLGTLQRSSAGLLKNLSVPAAFLNQPATL